MRQLWDADILVYRCAFAAEKRNYYLENTGEVWPNKKELNAYVKANNIQEPRIWVEHIVEPLEYALYTIKACLKRASESLGGEKPELFLTGKGNFREKLSTIRVYKGNRDPTHKPVHYKAAREYVRDVHGAWIVDGMEADDALGIEASKNPKESVIVTNDKDLRQIPTWHYNWTVEGATPEWVGPRESKLFFYNQLITGDATDNIPGLEGAGPAEARKILEGASTPIECEIRILKAYTDKYGKEEGVKRFLETGNLVRILKKEEEKDVLWVPLIELPV